jgi:acyl carrier protein
VESVIARQRDVRDVILAVEDPPGQDARLVAYVVLTAEAHGVANRGAGQLRWQGQSLQRELHEFAANALPGYMLPARYVTLPAIPVTAHGKVDREALPTAAPLLDGPEHRPAESLTATERAVAATWAKYLGLEHLSRDDHFLEIGGHSLVAVQVIAEVREHFAVDLPIRALFDNPVLADFATAVDAIRAPA